MTLSDEDFLARARISCTEKAAFASRAELKTNLRNHDYTGTIYKCPFCGYFHHTTYDRHRSKAFSRRLRSLLK